MSISRKAVCTLLLLPLLCVAVVNIAYLWRQTKNPGDTNYPESLAVYWIQNVAAHKPLYTDFRQPPYNLTSYGPLYYFAVANLTRWFHLSTDDVFIWGRRFTFFCALLVALFVFIKVKRDASKMTPAIFAGSFFLSSYILFPIAATCRADMLAAVFSLAGILIYFFNAKRTVRFCSLILFVAAYFTKQTYISAVITLIAVEFYSQPRKAAVMAALYAGSIGAILLIMHLATHGLSTLNMITSNFGPMRFFNVRIITNNFLQSAPLVLIIGIAALAAGAFFRFEGIYFLVSFAVAIFTSAKTGSSVNYFVEPLIASALLTPFVLNAIANESSGRRFVSALVVATFWVLLIPQFNFLLRSVQSAQSPDETEIRRLVAEAQGRVLSDSPRLAFLAREPLFLDALNLSFMELQGRWSSDGIVEMLKRHEIQYAIFTMPVERSSTWQSFHKFPEKVLKEIAENYRLRGLINNYYVYVPR